MVFDKKSLIIPNDAKFEEHNIVTSGDFIIGDRANFEMGVITDGRIFVGEKSQIKGSLESKDDIRIDMWSQVDGNVSGEKDVFLAERSRSRESSPLARIWILPIQLKLRSSWPKDGSTSEIPFHLSSMSIFISWSS